MATKVKEVTEREMKEDMQGRGQIQDRNMHTCSTVFGHMEIIKPGTMKILCNEDEDHRQLSPGIQYII